MLNNNANLLQHVYLFKDLNPGELNQVVQLAKEETFHAGDHVFTEGDKATALYIVKYGTLKIQRSGRAADNEVAMLGTGSHFGEMSFLDGEKRSATVEVIERADLVRIDFDALRIVLESDKAIAMRVYQALAMYLCNRLRATMNDLSFAREKAIRHA